MNTWRVYGSFTASASAGVKTARKPAGRPRPCDVFRRGRPPFQSGTGVPQREKEAAVMIRDRKDNQTDVATARTLLDVLVAQDRRCSFLLQTPVRFSDDPPPKGSSARAEE
ncbi:MAG: hypothetical protein J0H01_06960 [Rhizobiales bacterium]|nr:hypothetical protein [Hyphomicrobiales bacterium]